MGFFVGKTILIISVKFFNYENLIKDQLSALGAKVDLFDERPSNSFYSKAIIRFKKSLYQRRINKYYQGIIDQIKHKKYDYFLLIKGEAVPVFFISFLRSNYPMITLVYYTYDSFKNNPNGLEIMKFFDKKFTFDRVDAKKYELSFRPLFFDQEYAKIHVKSNQSFEYDLSFIGTAHSDRYKLSQQIDNWCIRFGLRMFNFYYSPSKVLFFYKKNTDKNLMGFDSKKISFNSLEHGDIINIYSKTKAILDINHPGQNGLTMRTFEALGAGRKLVTTNDDIKCYPFYNPKNIFIIDRKDPKMDLDFFKDEFQEIDSSLYFYMSLRGWIFELFEKESDIWKI